MKKLLIVLFLLLSIIYSIKLSCQINSGCTTNFSTKNIKKEFLKSDKTIRILSNSSIDASLGFENFVSGITPVINKFTTQNEPPNVSLCAFVILDSNYVPIATNFGSKIDSHWTTSIDMGLLRQQTGLLKTEDKMYLRAYFLVLGNKIYTPLYELGIIKKPEWLNDSKLSNVIISNDSINFDVSLPIKAALQNTIPNSIQAINDRTYSFYDVNLKFGVTYDLKNRESIVNDPKLYFDLNILDQSVSTWNMNFGEGNEYNLDSNFNIYILIQKEANSKEFKVNFPALEFPIVPTVTLKVDAGLKLLLNVRGKIVAGIQNDNWGFIRIGQDVTSLTTSIAGDAFVRARLSVLWGAASATGSLIVSGKIGGGFEYESIPEENLTTIFGGELGVSGRLLIETFWGFGPQRYYEQEFYHDNFGNFPGLIVKDYKEREYGILSQTKKLDLSLIPPESYPQPNFNSKNNFGAVWVENTGNNGYLLLSLYDKIAKIFKEQFILASNKNSISNPKLAFTSDGSAIIIWSQNRYSEETVPDGFTLIDLLSAQDIWCAIYDQESNKIIYNWFISDENLMGRGEASVYINSNDKAVVSWIVKDNGDNSRIYSKNVYKNNGVWYQSQGENISDINGINRNVKMCQFNKDNLFAVWINESNDPKNSDNRIMMNTYDGNDWEDNSILFDKNTGLRSNDLSINMNNNYGALGWISTFYNQNGSFLYNLNVKVWDASNGQWIGGNAYNYYDSVNCIQQPKIAITDNDIGVLAYKSFPMYTDFDQNIHSKLHLSLCDLKNPAFSWKPIIYVPDTNVTIWDMDVSVNDDILYLITQERDTILGNNYVPETGIRFGSPDAGLVLRTWRINQDLTFTKIDEPGTPSGINDNPTEVNLDLRQNYPNPVSLSTIIEYKIPTYGNVKLEIFDMLGKKIATLLDDNISSGIYQTSFIPNNLSSGVYVYKLTFNNNSLTKMMIINK